MFSSSQEPYKDIKSTRGQNGSIAYLVPDDMEKFLKITKSLIEKSKKKVLSCSETNEFGWTDAKIYAMRVDHTISASNAPNGSEKVLGKTPPEAVGIFLPPTKDSLETLFSSLSKEDPHYQDAVKARKMLEGISQEQKSKIPSFPSKP